MFAAILGFPYAQKFKLAVCAEYHEYIEKKDYQHILPCTCKKFPEKLSILSIPFI